MVQQQKAIPVIDVSMRELCKKPYGWNPKTRRFSHPKGCPKYGKSPSCPPQAPLWSDVCDIGLATWLFWTRFDLAGHREKMKAKHPNWSRRQLNCCLYWQKGARKLLQELTKQRKQIPGFYITMCPEAMGINVTQTMREIGIDLEWPPEHWAYQIAIGGWLS